MYPLIRAGRRAAVLASCVVLGCAGGESERRPGGAGDGSIPPERLTLELGAGVTMDLVLIPPGTFRMGAGRLEGGSARTVTIAQPFYMGATEVTNAQLRCRPGEE